MRLGRAGEVDQRAAPARAARARAARLVARMQRRELDRDARAGRAAACARRRGRSPRSRGRRTRNSARASAAVRAPSPSMSKEWRNPCASHRGTRERVLDRLAEHELVAEQAHRLPLAARTVGCRAACARCASSISRGLDDARSCGQGPAGGRDEQGTGLALVLGKIGLAEPDPRSADPASPRPARAAGFREHHQREAFAAWRASTHAEVLTRRRAAIVEARMAIDHIGSRSALTRALLLGTSPAGPSSRRPTMASSSPA